MIASPQYRYQATAIETGSPVDLVVRLYQGVIRFTERGANAVQARNIEGAHESFTRAEAIVRELAGTLNFERGGEIAPNLMAVYDYALGRLVEANCQKRVEPAHEVVELFRSLLTAWQEVAERCHREPALAARPLRRMMQVEL